MEELNPFEKILGKRDGKKTWPEPESNDDLVVIPKREKPKLSEE